MAGACGFLLIAFYIVYDYKFAADAPPLWQRWLRTGFMPARWVGLNTIFIYLLTVFNPFSLASSFQV